MRTLLFAALLSFLLPVLAKAGGPWPQGKGEGYVKLSEWWLRFDRHYTADGLTDPNLTTGVYNTFLYGEYGLTDRLTGIVNANLFGRNVVNEQRSSISDDVLVPGEALNAFGDVDVALKYTLTQNQARVPFSVTLLLGLPTGNPQAGALGNLQTGDGEFNQMLRVDAAHGFGLGKVGNAYVAAYGGLNNRTGGFSDEWRVGAEAGLGLLSRKLWLIGRVDVVESFKNGESAATFTGSGIFANSAEFVGLGWEANYYLTDRLGVSVGATGALRGELIAAAGSWQAGVFFDW